MRRLPRTLFPAIVVLALLAVVLTLTSERTTGVDGAGPPPADVWIDITDSGFSPATALVQAGANVHWSNLASDDQSVVSDEGLFDSSTLAPGTAANHAQLLTERRAPVSGRACRRVPGPSASSRRGPRMITTKNGGCS